MALNRNEAALKAKLEKLSKELCRQAVARRKTERSNLERIHAILNEGGKRLDPDLQDLGDKLIPTPCCPQKAGFDETF